MLTDIEKGDWRLKLVPNEQALHHALVSIRVMCVHGAIEQIAVISHNCDEHRSTKAQRRKNTER